VRELKVGRVSKMFRDAIFQASVSM